MEKIMELNNLAVACMDANQFKEAVHNLVWALELSKDQLYRNPPLSQPGNPSAPHHHHHDILPHQSSRHDDGTSTILVANNSNDVDHADHLRNVVQGWPFHYSSAITYQHPVPMFPDSINPTITPSSLLPYSRSSSTPFSNAEAHNKRTIGLSVIIIFNLALCYDLLASSSTTTTIRQQVLMAKAVALYEKVVELHLQSTMDSDGDHHDFVTNTSSRGVIRRRHASMVDAQQDMVVMAAMNNLVQSWHRDEDSSSSKETYIPVMMELLQEIQHTEYPTEEMSTMVDSQARVFVSNMILASSTNMTYLSALALSAAAA